MSNSLGLDQDQHFVQPDLGPNCLQKLSEDDTRRHRVKSQTKKNLLQQKSNASKCVCIHKNALEHVQFGIAILTSYLFHK